MQGARIRRSSRFAQAVREIGVPQVSTVITAGRRRSWANTLQRVQTKLSLGEERRPEPHGKCLWGGELRVRGWRQNAAAGMRNALGQFSLLPPSAHNLVHALV